MEEALARGTIVTHQAAGMTKVESPAEGLGSLISSINNARNVMHDDLATSMPLLLKGKVLNVDMMRTGGGGWLAFINHCNGGHVILIEWSRSSLGKTKLSKNGSKVFGKLGGSSTSADKFGFI